MKKMVMATVLAATTVVASAQMSWFGIVDARYAVGNGSTSNVTALRNSGMAASRLGLRGSETIGNDMKASFWLEAALNNDDGTGFASSVQNQDQTAAGAGTQGLTFNRRSTVSLENARFGELRLGRDYTPQFWSETAFDPFGTQGVGQNVAYNKGGNTGVRASNSIAWLSPSVGGLALWAQTYMGENASTAAKVGDGNAYRVTFDKNALSLAYANSKTTTGATTTNETSNIAGSYDLKVAKLIAMKTTTKNTNAADINGRLVGATAPVAGGTLRVSYGQTEQAGKIAKKTAIGFVNPLSKRTDVYVTYATIDNSGGSTAALNGAVTGANKSSSGYDIGIKHSF